MRFSSTADMEALSLLGGDQTQSTWLFARIFMPLSIRVHDLHKPVVGTDRCVETHPYIITTYAKPGDWRSKGTY
jgi:hypothetical protein